MLLGDLSVFSFLHLHLLHLAEQIAGKDQVVEFLVGGADGFHLLVFVDL